MKNATFESIMNEKPEILVCPECKSDVKTLENQQLTCSRHGVIGIIKSGIYDFLAGSECIPVAAGGSFDLIEDSKKASFTEEKGENLSFRELQAVVAEYDVEMTTTSVVGARAIQRFNKNYAKMDAEIGLEAGQSIIDKVNPHLECNGLEPLGGRIALEAGGGHGLHLPVFSKYFDRVVFLDCSLVNLRMGKKLADENGFADQIVFVRADATQLPFASNTFDFVHEAGVIEHVDEPQKLVSEALRVLSESGNYVCLSPNRYPLSPEPHFRLPLFGLFPKALRKRLITITRGLNSEAGTDLRSLSDLRRYFENAGEKNIDPYFLPRNLSKTTRKSFARSVVQRCLQLPVIGRAIDLMLNSLLLTVMPYHIVVVSRKSHSY